ncbi:MAG: hypothetical protein P4L99_19345 [Chthoniobacter sp.]|nr:hypothetical protein [Chthoniobacter sp.]
MSAVEELTKICETLPAQKVEELVDFARFLQTRIAESPDDAAWERIIAEERPRPKLDAFVAAALAEGPAIPLEGNL